MALVGVRVCGTIGCLSFIGQGVVWASSSRPSSSAHRVVLGTSSTQQTAPWPTTQSAASVECGSAARVTHTSLACCLFFSCVLQGKYDTALAAVRGPLGASFSLSAERREAEAAILHAQGDLAAAAQLYQQALQQQPDDWAVLMLYLDCMLPATASTLPACGLTAVAQMATGVEASTQAGCQAGGLAALMAAVRVGE